MRTVLRWMPKRRAASRWLRPSTWQAWRTRAYSSTGFILTLPAAQFGRKIGRRRTFLPPWPDTPPAASVRDFHSAALTGLSQSKIGLKTIKAMVEKDLGYLPRVAVAITSARSYLALLGRAA